MKIIFTLIFTIFIFYLTNAQQTFLMPSGSATASYTTCNGFFYDRGGISGEYGQYQNSKVTFLPQTPNIGLKVIFSKFILDTLSILKIYDGPDINSNLIATFDNEVTPLGMVIRSTTNNTTGALTFVLISGDIQSEGWAASITCDIPCQSFSIQLNNQMLSHPIIDSIYTKACLNDFITLGAEAVFSNNNVAYNQTQSSTNFIWKFDPISVDTSQIVIKQFNQPTLINYTLKAKDNIQCLSTNVIKGTIIVSGNPIVSVDSVINTSTTIPIYVSASDQFDPTLLFQPITLQIPSNPAQFINIDTALIPDATGICYEGHLMISNYNANQFLQNINQLKSIKLNVEHSWLGDLSIRVTCPSGQDAILKCYNATTPVMSPNGIIENSCSSFGGSLHVGGAIDPLTSSPCFLQSGVGLDYIFKPGAISCFGQGGPTVSCSFTDSCGQAISPTTLKPSVSHISTGYFYNIVYYGSYQNLSSLVGCPLNGDWNITICDHTTGDNGYFFNWGIEFDESLQIDPLSYSIHVDSSSWVGQNLTQTDPFNAVIFNQNPGINNYSVTLIDENGCEYDTSFIVNTILRIDDFSEESSSIKIFPNPTNGVVSISNDINPIALIQIYSINGLLLYEKSVNEYYHKMDLSLYQSGVYICKVTTSIGDTKQFKIIKK